MAKKQRNFYLLDEDFAKLEKFTEENGFSSNSNALSYLISHLDDNTEEKIAIAVREELDKKYMPKERLRWGVQTAEQNSIVILDAINTLLYMLDPETLMPADTVPHKIVKQSRGIIKERIAYLKQRSDDRKKKRTKKINKKEN